MGCFDLLIFLSAGLFMMLSLMRWFEQTTEAVDARDWGRVTLLIVFPLAVWKYPSRISAGRPVPVPLHEPVRGFGKVKLDDPGGSPPASTGGETPPPGTPGEFPGMPVIPPKKPGPKKPAVDPEKVAKLRQKMIEQGLIPPDEK